MAEDTLDRIYTQLEQIEHLGESFLEGFHFLNEMQDLPEENQLIILAEIAFEVDSSQLAQKYSSRFAQKQDKTLFALSYLRIQLDPFKEELQEFYTPVLSPEDDSLVWFDPECNIDDVIRKCFNSGEPGDVLCDLNGIKNFQMARAITLFKKKTNGDSTIREKDINDATEIARKSAVNIADLQLKADIFQHSGNQINIRVQQSFNTLADSLPEEQKGVLPDIVGKFLAWADTRKAAIDVTPEEPVKRGRGRPRKLPRNEDFK